MHVVYYCLCSLRMLLVEVEIEHVSVELFQDVNTFQLLLAFVDISYLLERFSLNMPPQPPPLLCFPMSSPTRTFVG